MRATAENATTSQKFYVDVDDSSLEELRELARDRVSDSKLKAYIDNLDISADAKALIASIIETAVFVGDIVVPVVPMGALLRRDHER